jgi:NADH dehydrogenase (ubiquinone) 1 beta subcomplex subunit 7
MSQSSDPSTAEAHSASLPPRSMNTTHHTIYSILFYSIVSYHVRSYKTNTLLFSCLFAAGVEMVATRKEMFEASVPIHWRDYCAHMLIPLNDCRRVKYYLPWECTDERHAYEQCQYKDWLWRKQAKDIQKQQQQQQLQ